jgi:hypothetical protein
MGWWESTDGGNTYNLMGDEWDSDYRPFKAGNFYKVEAYVSSNNDYYFCEDVTATINGKPAETYMSSHWNYRNCDAIYIFGELKSATPAKEITNITIENVLFPFVGGEPRYDWKLAEDTAKCCDRIMPGAGSIWYRLAIGQEEDLELPTNWENEADAPYFEAGRMYRLKTILEPKQGYEFADSVTVEVKDVHGQKVSGYALKNPNGTLVVMVDFDTAEAGNTAAPETDATPEATSDATQNSGKTEKPTAGPDGPESGKSLIKVAAIAVAVVVGILLCAVCVLLGILIGKKKK